MSTPIEFDATTRVIAAAKRALAPAKKTCAAPKFITEPAKGVLRSGLCVIAAVFTATSAARAQTITTINALPGYNSVHPVGVSADGSVVVGYCNRRADNNLPHHIFRWTRAGGMQDLSEPAGGDGAAMPTGVSGDGSTIVGSESANAFKWTQAGGYEVIPGPVNQYGSGAAQASAVNGDGSVVVGTIVEPVPGSFSQYSLYWRPGIEVGRLPGFATLEPLSVGSSGFYSYLYGSHFSIDATGVSADGCAVVGPGGSVEWVGYWQGVWQLLLWTASTGFHPISPLPGDTSVASNALSADGTTVLGESWGSLGDHAILYTITGGTQDLGSLSSGFYVHMVGVSRDGSAIVGLCVRSDGVPVAALWTAATGMVDLNTYLPTRGVDLAGSQLGTLYSAKAISADGTTIAGEQFDGINAWVVNLTCLTPPSLPAQPSAASTCPSGSAIFSITAAGAGPITYQWQRADQSVPAGWTDLADGLLVLPAGPAAMVAGSHMGTLTLGDIQANGEDFRDFRCIVSNECGSATSDPATLTVCAGDFNCDGFLDPLDYNGFINAFESGSMDADFNLDGFLDPLDYNGYINAFEAGC